MVCWKCGAEVTLDARWWWEHSQGMRPRVECRDEVACAERVRQKLLNIHDAAEKGDLQRVKSIADANPSAIHLRGWAGETPLHYAAVHGHAHVAKELLRRGVDINVRDLNEATPLIFAAMQGRHRTLLTLLAHGADMEPRDCLGGTALETAKKNKKNKWEAVTAALEAVKSMSVEQRKAWAAAQLDEGQPRAQQGSGRRVNSNCLSLYHYTTRHAADAIVRTQQMVRGAGGAAGGGIYFARTYADAWRKAWQGKEVCLQADVWMGRSKVCSSVDPTANVSSLQQQGYDSVWLTCLNGDELVVYNYDQVENIRVVSS